MDDTFSVLDHDCCEKKSLMDNLEIRLSFERTKNATLNKIQKVKEKWQRFWQEAQGNPAAETSLVHLMLEIQLMEVETLEELNRIEEKIKGFKENSPPANQL